MRAILIDPTNKSVTDVDYSGDYHDITKLIAAESGLFATVRLFGIHVMYVDDEGLLVNPNPNGYFRIEGYPGVLAGKGLIVGTTVDGDDTDTFADLELVRNGVTFIDEPDADDIEPRMEFISFGE